MARGAESARLWSMYTVVCGWHVRVEYGSHSWVHARWRRWPSPLALQRRPQGGRGTARAQRADWPDGKCGHVEYCMVYRRPGAGAPAPVPVPRRRCRSRDQSFRYAGRRFVSHFFYRVSFGSHGCALMVCWLLRCTPCAVGRGRGRVFGRYIAKTAVYGFSVSRLACIDYCEMCIRSFY